MRAKFTEYFGQVNENTRKAINSQHEGAQNMECE